MDIKKATRALGIGVLMIFSSLTHAQQKVVNIYNWAEYTAPDTLSKFEKQTGIKPRYDVYDSNETLQAKLLTGHSGYDVVVPSSHYAARQIEADLFQKLDKSKLPNFKYLDPELMALVTSIDPGNLYTVPWGYGTNGLGYNVTQVKKILGKKVALNNWDMLFKPEYAEKLKQCGISMLDEASQVFPAVLHYLGKDPNSSEPDDYKEALALLKKIRPFIRQFSSAGYIDELASGDLCMVYGFSGDVIIAQQRARESKKLYEIDYFIPKGGAPLWFDLIAIPKDATHVQEAHTFINYIETPQVHAAITNSKFNPSANKESRKYINKEVATNPMLYPSAQVFKTLFLIKPQPLAIQRLQTRLWSELKSGR